VVAVLPFPSPRVVNLAGATLNALRYAPTPLGNPMARAIPEVAALEAESAAAAAATAAAAKPLKPAGGKLATVVGFLRKKPRAAPAVITAATNASGPSPAAAAQAAAAPPPPPPPMNCSGVGAGGVGARRRRVMLLSHFYNEALLLPHFVRHHAHMFDHAVLIYVEDKAHLAELPGLQAADWPRMAEAWGCPGPESATAGACRRQIWPK